MLTVSGSIRAHCEIAVQAMKNRRGRADRVLLRRFHKAILLGAIALAIDMPVRWTFADKGDAKKPDVTASHFKTPSRGTGGRSSVRFHAQAKSLADAAVTSDWPRFLGPTHNGISPETKLLKKFPSGGPTLVWEMETGNGYSCPAVVGDCLVYIHRVGNEEVVECRRADTGEPMWSFHYPTSYRDEYGFSNGPRCGPVIDADRVYTYGVEGKLHCLRIKTGALIWKRDLKREYNVPQEFFGVGTTPLVEGDLLVVNVGAPGGPSVIALHKRTGKTAWQAGGKWGASYASPIPADLHGRRRVFVFAGGDSRPPTGGLMSIDPANGRIDFRLPFRSKRYKSVNAASPVVVGHQVFVTTSYDTGGALVDVLPTGGYELAWKTDALRCHFATPIYRDGYLYGFDGERKSATAIVCVDLKTGKQLWRHLPEWEEKIAVNGRDKMVTLGVFRGGMIFADDRFLCLGELGHLLWLDLSPKGYKELARTRLFYAAETWTPLVLSRGLLYVTQNSRDTITDTSPRLLCYDLREK